MDPKPPGEEIPGTASVPPHRGPTAQRGVVQQQLVTAARSSFAEHGWAGTSMRAVAKAAGTDPRLVGYYFADKTALLEASLQPPAGFLEGVARTVKTPLRQRGAALLRFQLHAWTDPSSHEVLRSIILIAAHHPLALERLQAIYRTSLIGAVASSLGDDERHVRAGLVATQMIGVGMARYVWKLEPVASMSGDSVIALIGPTLQRYLTGRLPKLDESRRNGDASGSQRRTQ